MSNIERIMEQVAERENEKYEERCERDLLIDSFEQFDYDSYRNDGLNDLLNY